MVQPQVPAARPIHVSRLAVHPQSTEELHAVGRRHVARADRFRKAVAPGDQGPSAGGSVTQPVVGSRRNLQLQPVLSHQSCSPTVASGVTSIEPPAPLSHRRARACSRCCRRNFAVFNVRQSGQHSESLSPARTISPAFRLGQRGRATTGVEPWASGDAVADFPCGGVGHERLEVENRHEGSPAADRTPATPPPGQRQFRSAAGVGDVFSTATHPRGARRKCHPRGGSSPEKSRADLPLVSQTGTAPRCSGGDRGGATGGPGRSHRPPWRGSSVGPRQRRDHDRPISGTNFLDQQSRCLRSWFCFSHPLALPVSQLSSWYFQQLRRWLPVSVCWKRDGTGRLRKSVF